MLAIDLNTLVVAYSAVKAQRMRGDLNNLWDDDIDPNMRDSILAAEMVLETLLRQAKIDRENLQRGGPKQRDRW